MAELLIRIVDKVNGDHPHFDVQCTKHGDVIAVCPDGWPWSETELAAPFWRILKVPGLMMTEAEALLSGERGDPRLNRMLQRRAFKLDIAQLSGDTATLQAFRAAKVAKPAKPDPFVIGDDPKVIG